LIGQHGFGVGGHQFAGFVLADDFSSGGQTLRQDRTTVSGAVGVGSDKVNRSFFEQVLY